MTEGHYSNLNLSGEDFLTLNVEMKMTQDLNCIVTAKNSSGIDYIVDDVTIRLPFWSIDLNFLGLNQQ